MSEERVQLTVDNHVATVRMSRPEKRNALDADMFDGLIRIGKINIAQHHWRNDAAINGDTSYRRSSHSLVG